MEPQRDERVYKKEVCIVQRKCERTKPKMRQIWISLRVTLVSCGLVHYCLYESAVTFVQKKKKNFVYFTSKLFLNKNCTNSCKSVRNFRRNHQLDYQWIKVCTFVVWFHSIYCENCRIIIRQKDKSFKTGWRLHSPKKSINRMFLIKFDVIFIANLHCSLCWRINKLIEIFSLFD